MSLILDALKKIERDKRRSDGAQIESIALSRGRFVGRQHVLSMVAIAFGSALLTAAAVSFLNNKPQGTKEAEAATVPVTPPEVEAPPVVEVETPRRPTAAPPVVAETVETSVRAREPVPAPASVSGPASMEKTPGDSTQPIRLVGRERALLTNPNRKIFEARKRETAALGAGEKLVLGHPLAATIGDSARCMQNLEKVLFTGPKTSDTVTFICD